MIKRIAIVGLVLLLIGIAGSIFTLKSKNEAKDLTQQEVEIQDAFNAIEIMSNEARVEVLPTSDSVAKIELTGAYSNYHLAADVEGSTLKVNVGYQQKKLFNFDFTASLLSLKVYVPEKEYASLQIESGNGRVLVENLQAKDLRVKTDNGHIKLAHIEGGKVVAKADNGTVDMENVKAVTVDANADNGQVILDDVEGKLIGQTNNGSISLKTHDIDRAIDFETDNGKVTIQTEKAPTNVIIDAKAENGKVTVFGRSDWDTVIGDGENLIKITAKNGTITIK